jgi:hypothetical protein
VTDFPIAVERRRNYAHPEHIKAVRVWRECDYNAKYPQAPLFEPARWTVSMPHQCDSWEIASDATVEEAKDAIDALISALHGARMDLVAGRENGVDVE